MTYEEFLRLAIERFTEHPRWRWGQTLFNVLAECRPDLSEQVRSTDLDPFYMTATEVPKFSEWLKAHWVPE